MSADIVEFENVKDKQGPDLTEIPEDVKSGHVGDGEEEYTDVRCGIRGCRPSFLQRFNNPKALCFCLCAYTLVQGKLLNVCMLFCCAFKP